MFHLTAVVVLVCLFGRSDGARDNSQYVSPVIGAGGFGYGCGSLPPGAMWPFGLCRASPDTAQDEFRFAPDHIGGYAYKDTHIRYFSHTHMVGAGIPDLGNVGVTATSVSVSELKLAKWGYRSHFSHETEVLRPGYYAVKLETFQVLAELAAAGPEVAMHRYTYPFQATGRNVIVDLQAALSTGSPITDSAVEIDIEHNEISGWVMNKGGLTNRFGGLNTSFVIQLDAQVLSAGTGVFVNGTLHEGVLSMQGTHIGAVLSHMADTVELKVAISFLSVAQARTNLASQAAPAVDFASAMAASQAEWARLLATVDVDSDDSEMLTKFYTAMYHTLMSPTKYSETDGWYRTFGETNHIAQAPKDERVLSDMSLWDTHRTLNPWLTLVQPDVSLDIARSLVRMAEQGGDMPRWPLAHGFTGCMIGNHGFQVIADTYLKGLTAFNLSAAYAYMRVQAVDPSRPHGRGDALKDYLSLGYVSLEDHKNDASLTLSFAFDDHAVATVASLCGNESDAAMFRQRSLNYVNVWDAERQYMCPRTRAGKFECPLLVTDPFDSHYTEGDAEQWRWFVPHDPAGLVRLFRSNETFADKLNVFFNASRAQTNNYLPNEYYWAGNEPDLLAVWLFNYAGRPDLTQYWSRWLSDFKYTVDPDGVPGNDDYGTMSAWLTFTMLGLYPQTGSTRYFLGSPQHKGASLHLPSGTLRITVDNYAERNIYVRSVLVNGVSATEPFVDHADLVRPGGAQLHFTMSDTPSPFLSKHAFQENK